MLERDLLGLPLLLVRDLQGEIQVLPNLCRHRGARLVAGQDTVCRQTGLTCPHHAWRSDLDGTLRGLPQAAGFPTAPGEIRFVHTMFTPHAARNAKEQAHWDRSFDMIDGGVFSAEDLFISEQIQQGVASGANDSFVLGRFEQHLRRFHAQVQGMLRG